MSLDFLNTRDMQRHDAVTESSILIDSRDRNRTRFPSSTSYEIELPEVFHNVTEAHLTSAEVPASFYVFSTLAKNTTLSVSIGEDVRTLELPDGNYSLNSIGSTLQSLLNALFEDTTTRFDVHVNPNTYRLVFHADTVIQPFRIITPDFVPNTGHWGLGYYLGLERNRTYEGDENDVIEGTRPTSLNPDTYLLLEIEELGRVSEPAPLGVGGAGGFHTFAKIPIPVDSFSVIQKDRVLTKNTLTPPVTRLRKLRISWKFHDGRPVDFQNLDHSFTLQLTHTPLRSN